ncbi:MAG: UDP-N-acetylmuramate--L-alanine ligase [Clostridiales bacterium]|nr:UDP-N-acetylmuramate--L-alanine ligase [Clostridiales bacterium]
MNGEGEIDLQAKKLHFIGIGGIGMSGIAKILLHNGYQISGSDLSDSFLLDHLRSLGAQIYIGHQPDNIPEDTEMAVHSTAISADNCELLEAKKRGLPVVSRAQMLSFLMRQKRSIGIAGSHGKTTTSGMISLLLEQTGMDPTIIIGGTLPQINSNGKSGKGEYLVAEADESDGTFLLLHPAIAVITNIEEDHMDFYKSMDDITNSFAIYVRQLPQDGFAVVNADCPQVRKIMKEIPADYVTYSICGGGAEYTACDFVFSAGGSGSNIYHLGKFLGRLELNIPGKHNVSNALAAIALGSRIGLEFKAIAAALAGFSGTGRRFELLGKVNDIVVIDDYAHHPTEIKATIAAARQTEPGRLITVFQPHRYSRTQVMKGEFGRSFAESHLTIINEIYEAFEQPIEGVSARLIVEEAKKTGYKPIVYAKTQEEVVELLLKETGTGDMVLIMGAGDIRNAGEEFVRRLKDEKEATI